MIKKQAQKSSRLALFSENECAYLKGKKPLNTVRKSQFHHDLDLRFDALLKDLELIKKSKYLKAWKSLRAFKYNIYFKEANYFLNLFMDIEKGYQLALRRISSGKGKHKKHRYWLDLSPLKDKKIDERIFNSEFLFRHIREGLSDKDKKLLLRATDNQGILPLKKKDAISLDEIKKRLSGESKVRINVVRIKTVTKDTFKDPRNYEINKIIEKHKKRNEKALNKKLAKYDSKIMCYLLSPSFHGESE